ncbi:MAG: GspH/FimT family pseudopilin [Synechococcaceae cyanobacterium]|jgi:hypothetical protein
MDRSAGLSTLELLLAAALLALLTLPCLQWASASLALQQVESASRRVIQGLEQGRAAAERSGQPCGLRLQQDGWGPPLGGGLPACPGVELPLLEAGRETAIQLRHNLPEVVRFTSNGLVLDGGTVLVGAEGTQLVRCVVMALPLGVVRIGRWQEQECRPDPAL